MAQEKDINNGIVIVDTGVKEKKGGIIDGKMATPKKALTFAGEGIIFISSLSRVKPNVFSQVYERIGLITHCWYVCP